MHTAKEFLTQECDNVRAVLDETLRFKYGLDGSQPFFKECKARLDSISDRLDICADSDFADLSELAKDLGELSALISRIERSSLEEYSWPFVEELKRVAVAICTEDSVTEPDRPPMIHVLSDGGLDKYAIYPEASRPTSAGKRILTIVFPRSLKHFVLLHSILGHEIGHAMWQCSKNQRDLDDILSGTLFSSGIFHSEENTLDWLYNADAPENIRDELEHLWTKFGINRDNLFDNVDWLAWKEEILCDFIGLLTFGPSFVAAACNLLQSLDPRGTAIGTMHPPVQCRVNYLLTAAEMLGFDNASFKNKSTKRRISVFWETLRAKREQKQWFDIFSEAQVREAITKIGSLLEPLQPALYPEPSDEHLSRLLAQLDNLVPPVGCTLDADSEPICYEVDFRHILYAGWIKSCDLSNLSFEQLNRLCGHGILQQKAIAIELGDT